MNTPTPTPRTDAAWSASFEGKQLSAGQTARSLRDCSQQLERELAALTAERDQLRADYERACQTVAQMHAAAVGEVCGPRRGIVEDLSDLRAERDQLRADRYYNRKCINRLASATGTLGEKSEKVVEVALSTIDQLRAEAAQTVALANWNGVLERALKAEAERDHLHAQLRALTLICGTNDANKFETWIDRANARAERAEAELAAERARLDWLQAQEVKRGLEITEGHDDSLPFLVLDEDGTTHWGDTYRAAIDAAMKEGAK